MKRRRFECFFYSLNVPFFPTLSHELFISLLRTMAFLGASITLAVKRDNIWCYICQSPVCHINMYHCGCQCILEGVSVSLLVSVYHYGCRCITFDASISLWVWMYHYVCHEFGTGKQPHPVMLWRVVTYYILNALKKKNIEKLPVQCNIKYFLLPRVQKTFYCISLF